MVGGKVSKGFDGREDIDDVGTETDCCDEGNVDVRNNDVVVLTVALDGEDDGT